MTVRWREESAHRRGLASDLRVKVGLAGIPVDDKELPARRVGVLGGEAARQHGAGLHVEDELRALAAVPVSEQAGEVGFGGARDPHAGVEPDRAAPVYSVRGGNRRRRGRGDDAENT